MSQGLHIGNGASFFPVLALASKAKAANARRIIFFID